MQKKKLNIYDLAHKAGVSIATISRAINPGTRSRVAQGTLAKIDRAVKKYGYTPSLAAKALSLNATKTIGVIFPYLPGIFYSNYYNHILSGVSDYLYDSEYNFKLLLLKPRANKWDHHDFKSGDGIDGLLLTHWFKFFDKRQVFEEMNIPTVIINDFDPLVKTMFVGVDHFKAGQIAAQYLYEKGHRSIAILSGPKWSWDSAQRICGFTSFLKSKKITIPKTSIIEADFLEQKAYEQTKDLIALKNKITAIFSCNDQMAFGVIRRIKESGLSCPQNISVMGFDDETDAAKFNPSLTSIHVPVYDLAKHATKYLIERLQDPKPKPHQNQSLILPTRLVERRSVQQI